MAIRALQRSVPDYKNAATKVTPPRPWEQPERRFRPAGAEADDHLSGFGKLLKRYSLATLASVAAVLTGMPQDADERLREPSDHSHA